MEFQIFGTNHLTGLDEYIEELGLTKAIRAMPDDEGNWGDLIDPELIHDYVYEEGDE